MNKKLLDELFTYIKPNELRLFGMLFVIISILFNIYFANLYFNETKSGHNNNSHYMHHRHDHTDESIHKKYDINSNNEQVTNNFSFIYCENDVCKKYDKNGEHNISKNEARRMQSQIQQDIKNSETEMKRDFEEMEKIHDRMMQNFFKFGL